MLVSFMRLIKYWKVFGDEKNAKNSKKATCSISWVCFYALRRRRKVVEISSKICQKKQLKSSVTSLPIITSGQIEAKHVNQDLKQYRILCPPRIFSNSEEKIIISNHVLFLCEEILERVFVEISVQEGRGGGEDQCQSALNGSTECFLCLF